MGIHQVLCGPRGALRLGPKHTAVVTTTPGAREASPHLPPLSFRNEEFSVVAPLLCRWLSRVAKATVECSRTTISFNFLDFPSLYIRTYKTCTWWTALVDVIL